jgi:hypothetical protein
MQLSSPASPYTPSLYGAPRKTEAFCRTITKAITNKVTTLINIRKRIMAPHICTTRLSMKACQ